MQNITSTSQWIPIYFREIYVTNNNVCVSSTLVISDILYDIGDRQQE